MTPKEKAKKLVDMFYEFDIFDCENKVNLLELADSKGRALTCVDEIIEAVRHIVGEKLRTEYYLEVKQEIEKL